MIEIMYSSAAKIVFWFFFWLPSSFVGLLFHVASSGSKSILLNTEIKSKAGIKSDINTEN